jgi:hypothetical protein
VKRSSSSAGHCYRFGQLQILSGLGDACGNAGPHNVSPVALEHRAWVNDRARCYLESLVGVGNLAVCVHHRCNMLNRICS